ncbi:hypothetical protein Glove_402g89 [Diversispora epigaea]|uniref:Uncharacterized protein n=1 Tax=Diversispora epigaea TaxID=1348612 RepID=A0A397H3U8_9GLOM|nr:hypothetical protein Glove_402g89 [Diversispora epigaea]
MEVFKMWIIRKSKSKYRTPIGHLSGTYRVPDIFEYRVPIGIPAAQIQNPNAEIPNAEIPNPKSQIIISIFCRNPKSQILVICAFWRLKSQIIWDLSNTYNLTLTQLLKFQFLIASNLTNCVNH